MTYEGENMILVIVGPTGVGKTKLSVSLAHKYNAIILNGDSMQVYRDLNIGTAKVTEEEKEGVPHYLFDIVEPEEMYTVYDYQKDLRKILDDYKDKNETSFNNYDELSNAELLSKVKQKYPDLEFDINNRKRLVRALNKQD